jgi:hypothetical protein
LKGETEALLILHPRLPVLGDFKPKAGDTSSADMQARRRKLEPQRSVVPNEGNADVRPRLLHRHQRYGAVGARFSGVIGPEEMHGRVTVCAKVPELERANADETPVTSSDGTKLTRMLPVSVKLPSVEREIKKSAGLTGSGSMISVSTTSRGTVFNIRSSSEAHVELKRLGESASAFMVTLPSLAKIRASDWVVTFGPVTSGLMV